jgi:hypothetical protein
MLRNISVLVCGGRDYNDRDTLFAALDKLHRLRTVREVISGMARGADTLAIHWARANDLPVREFPADWDRHGRRAGYIRNQQMLDDGQPDLVVAFPGGKGTAMMIDISRKADVPVWEPT